MSGAGHDRDEDEPGGPAVEYRFFDSSVPPPFHRSFTLEVRPDSARLVVDSYGDVLRDVRLLLDAAAWDRCATAASSLAELVGGDFDDGYTGGTADRLVVRDHDGEVIVNRFESHRGIDPADSPLRAAVAGVLARFDLDRLCSTEPEPPPVPDDPDADADAAAGPGADGEA